MSEITAIEYLKIIRDTTDGGCELSTLGLDELIDEITALEAELAALKAPLSCGHEARFQMFDDDGDRCLACEEDRLLDALVNMATGPLAAAKKAAAAWKQAAKKERKEYNEEVEEFNAGFDAVKNGKFSMETEKYNYHEKYPERKDYDVFEIGYTWGKANQP